LRDFAAERRWQPLHTPKNLAMALMVEAAKLLEHFQWLTPEASMRAAADPGRRQQIGDAIADVLLPLLQLADHTLVDIDAAVKARLLAKARKHPAPSQRAAADPAPTAVPAAGALHVLLDFENVQPDDEQVRILAPQVARLWVFHGPHQKQVADRFASFGAQLTTVPISKTGKNALDFHLSFYMGSSRRAIPTRDSSCYNDKAMSPLNTHACWASTCRRSAWRTATRTSDFQDRRHSAAARKAPVAKKAAARPVVPASTETDDGRPRSRQRQRPRQRPRQHQDDEGHRQDCFEACFRLYPKPAAKSTPWALEGPACGAAPLARSEGRRPGGQTGGAARQQPWRPPAEGATARHARPTMLLAHRRRPAQAAPNARPGWRLRGVPSPSSAPMPATTPSPGSWAVIAASGRRRPAATWPTCGWTAEPGNLPSPGAAAHRPGIAAAMAPDCAGRAGPDRCACVDDEVDQRRAAQRLCQPPGIGLVQGHQRLDHHARVQAEAECPWPS
jgi:hypothetical protein